MTAPPVAAGTVLALLQEEGWARATMHEPGGGYCLLGAMVHTGVHASLGPRLAERIRQEYPRWGETVPPCPPASEEEDYGRIVYFNDTPGRTFTEVQAILEKIAADGT
jgi:hypothetical protein